MKIHIVQKGDTLWNLSKQYNVDFQALKAANSQLANPDMIMPGMKIKIPVAKKHVGQPKMAVAPKQKTMTPYKSLPQKAQPVIKEDDQKPKQKVKKKMPYPKLPPVSIQMPKLPNIYANQYNIDVDIDDYDTMIKTEQTLHQQQPMQPIEEPPVKQEPVKAQPVAEVPVALPQPNMMWVPCLPCSMMPYPPQAYYNLCDAYQDPAKLQQNCHYQNEQWQPQATQPYAYNQNQKWGELDINDQPDDDANQQLANQANYNPYYMPYQTQWPTQQMGYPSYPYNDQGYQNYATYAPRNDQSEGNDDN